MENDDILEEIRSLNIQKAHVPNYISICMIKIRDAAFVKPASLIFQNCLNCSTFPDIWKKSNTCPVLLTIKDLFHYCLYLGKYLKNLLLNLFLSILKTTNCSRNINPVSEKSWFMIHAHTNCCLLFMIYIQLSMLILLLKFEVCF